jgi:hypothetical protein
MPPSARASVLDRSALPAAILAFGLVLCGWFVGHGFLRGRSADRYVEVKGLAEHEVTADLALWPLRYVSTGDNLPVAQAGLTRWSYEIEGGRLLPVRYGTSSDVQFWNTTTLVVQYVLAHLPRP